MDLKLKYTIICLVVLSAATSCKKDWIDVTSSSQIKAEDQFNAESGFRDALMGVYIGMTDPSLFSKNSTWNIVDLLAQQYSTLNASAEFADVQQYRYRTIRSTSQVDAVWNKSYNVIANINSVLGAIDDKKSMLNPISYSIIKGELLGLRAFMHFHVLRLYGYGNISNRPGFMDKPSVPYVNKLTKDITPQLSYTQTFELLQSDITASLELLKEDPVYKAAGRPADYYTAVNRDGFYDLREQRMNYYAVKALQARSLLWQGGAANLLKAGTAAEEVIAGSSAKLINAGTVLVSERLFYSEHIFNLNVSGFENIVNLYLSAQDLAKIETLVTSQATAEVLYETQNTNIGVPDIRFNRLLEKQNKGMVSLKLLQTEGSKRNIMPLIKLPEMYYIAAENYIATNLTKAIEYLNIVRKSRGIVEVIPATADATKVTAELFKEYRKEFTSEGQLFFYYKRTGQTTFPGLSVGVVAGDNMYLLPYPDTEIEFGNRVQ